MSQASCLDYRKQILSEQVELRVLHPQIEATWMSLYVIIYPDSWSDRMPIVDPRPTVWVDFSANRLMSQPLTQGRGSKLRRTTITQRLVRPTGVVPGEPSSEALLSVCKIVELMLPDTFLLETAQATLKDQPVVTANDRHGTGYARVIFNDGHKSEGTNQTP
jgi:hypothetical protein